MRAPKRWKREAQPVEEGPRAADHFKAKLGWKPSGQPFHTTAKRECGGCHIIKPGNEFEVPITDRPDLNMCRECQAKP